MGIDPRLADSNSSNIDSHSGEVILIVVNPGRNVITSNGASSYGAYDVAYTWHILITNTKLQACQPGVTKFNNKLLIKIFL